MTGRGSALAGGLFGTFRPASDQPIIAAAGEGAELILTDGRRLLDHVLGSGPMVLGHSHPAVVEAIREQAGRGTQFYCLNDQALLLIDRIADLVPCAQAVKLVGDGSAATFFALRIARAATGRSKVLKFEGAYHGHNDYSLHSLQPCGDVSRPAAVPASGGIPGGVTDTVIIAPFNHLEIAERLIAEHAADLAAVIVEPVQRSIEPQPGFLAGLRAACDRAGTVLVFDEVVTGFRVALGGYQEVEGVMPDLCSLGKVIGGGLHLAALAGRADLLEIAVPGSGPDWVYLSGTLNGNPLSSAAGLATIDVLEDTDGPAHMARIGSMIGEGLTALAEERSLPFQMIGPPSFAQPVFGVGPIVDARSLRNVNDPAASAVFDRGLLDRGVFANSVAKLYVSVAHTEAHVDRFLTAAAGAIDDVVKFRAEGP